MIDYEKLKEEIDLMHKKICVENDKQTNKEVKFLCSCVSKHLANAYDSLNHLKNYISPEPKYEEGEEVWRVDCCKNPVSYIVNTIKDDTINGGYAYYDEQDCGWPEEQLFPSREALIKAQLSYWNNLLDEYPPDDDSFLTDDSKCNHDMKIGGVPECHHVMDGIKYGIKGLEDSFYKCKKCGELYR